MKLHKADELIYTAQVLAADGVTVLAAAIRCGVEDLAGRRLEQAQLISSETDNLIVMRYPDANGIVTDSVYIVVEGLTYVVDSRPLDPRKPRPKMWLEIPCHVERSGQ